MEIPETFPNVIKRKKRKKKKKKKGIFISSPSCERFD
jgi:hypothetical protein